MVQSFFAFVKNVWFSPATPEASWETAVITRTGSLTARSPKLLTATAWTQ